MHPPRGGLLRRDLVVTMFEDFRRHFAFIEPFRVAVKGTPDLLVIHRRNVQAALAERVRDRHAGQVTGIRQRIALDQTAWQMAAKLREQLPGIIFQHKQSLRARASERSVANRRSKAYLSGM